MYIQTQSTIATSHVQAIAAPSNVFPLLSYPVFGFGVSPSPRFWGMIINWLNWRIVSFFTRFLL